MTTLRSKLIRLAHENPELRGDLLPLLKIASTPLIRETIAMLKKRRYPIEMGKVTSTSAVIFVGESVRVSLFDGFEGFKGYVQWPGERGDESYRRPFDIGQAVSRALQAVEKQQRSRISQETKKLFQVLAKGLKAWNQAYDKTGPRSHRSWDDTLLSINFNEDKDHHFVTVFQSIPGVRNNTLRIGANTVTLSLGKSYSRIRVGGPNVDYRETWAADQAFYRVLERSGWVTSLGQHGIRVDR
jgi:hypothetical protein